MEPSAACTRHSDVMRIVPVLLLLCALGEGSCSTEVDRRSADDGDPSADRGSLTGAEYDLAVDTAEQIQSEVDGTFVGATAIASDQHRPPCDRDAGCPDKRLVYIRLVWNADASFMHSGEVTRPDGPNKALLIAVDPDTNDIVSRAAAYWSVAPDPTETLLYGQRL